jgi:hypothetical protein
MLSSFIRNFMMRRNTTAATVTPVVLGRWGIQYDPRIIDCKVFQANEDHCGCCVDVAANKGRNETLEKRIHDEKTEEYLLPYIL